MPLTATFVPASTVVTRTVIGMLSHSLAERMKRVLFVFSVLAAIDKTKGTDDRAIEQINGQLKLAKCPDLCKNSARQRDNLWANASKGKDIVNDFPALSVSTSSIERTMITRYYLKNCPDWIRYGHPSGSDMRRDLERLFNAIVTKDAD